MIILKTGVTFAENSKWRQITADQATVLGWLRNGMDSVDNWGTLALYTRERTVAGSNILFVTLQDTWQCSVTLAEQ